MTEVAIAFAAGALPMLLIVFSLLRRADEREQRYTEQLVAERQACADLVQSERDAASERVRNMAIHLEQQRQDLQRDVRVERDHWQGERADILARWERERSELYARIQAVHVEALVPAPADGEASIPLHRSEDDEIRDADEVVREVDEKLAEVEALWRG